MTTPKDMFWCDYCESYQPEADMVGDDEPICQSCYESKMETYRDVFGDMFSDSLEKLDGLGVAK